MKFGRADRGDFKGKMELQYGGVVGVGFTVCTYIHLQHQQPRPT